jgi:hypothetical protein
MSAFIGNSNESVSERPAELDQAILFVRLIEDIPRFAGSSHLISRLLKAPQSGTQLFYPYAIEGPPLAFNF